jgi:hypothetical protein
MERLPNNFRQVLVSKAVVDFAAIIAYAGQQSEAF